MSLGGSRIAAFLWVGVDTCFSRGRRVKLPDRVTRRPGVHLSDLEHMVLLAAPARRLGRAGQVELLLLLGDVGQDRAQALVLDNRCLVHLWPFVEGAIGQIDAVVSDRQSPVGVVNHRDPLRARDRVIPVGSRINSTWSYCSVRFIETVRSSFQANASSRSSCPSAGR